MIDRVGGSTPPYRVQKVAKPSDVGDHGKTPQEYADDARAAQEKTKNRTKKVTGEDGEGGLDIKA